ncbi:MAG TPA: DUF2461 domain-containing protein [Frankiaceae bacterium]|nr:DUF2461 domain-containing protein [Frankiaceae bacterium]
MGSTGFTGFPEELLTFYEGLEADNSKPYWADHRQQYETAVAGPMRALLDELGPEFGEAKFFRPYRDVRFSKDKTPYKTHAGAVVSRASGDGALYVQVSADGLLVAGGYYLCATDQAQRLRAAVADERTGAELEGILVPLLADGWSLGGDRLKRVPKEFAEVAEALGNGSLRADLLRAKALSAARHYPPDDELHTPDLRDRVATGWRAVRSLNVWLRDRVGPSRAVSR